MPSASGVFTKGTTSINWSAQQLPAQAGDTGVRFKFTYHVTYTGSFSANWAFRLGSVTAAIGGYTQNTSTSNPVADGEYITYEPTWSYSSGTTPAYLWIRSSIIGGGSGEDRPFQFEWPVTTITPQTVSLSNAGAPATNGASITGTATGAKGGNAYNISVTSGPATATINPTTGVYTITATGQGDIAYKVWISAGGSYSKSPDVYGGGNVQAGYHYHVQIPANNSPYQVEWTIKQGGVVIKTYLQAPGQGARGEVLELGANNGVVTKQSRIIGVVKDGVSLVEDPNGSVINPIVEETLPDNSPTPTPTPKPPVGSTPTVTTVNNANNNPTTNVSNTSNVWSATGGAAADTLTNATFREGVDKMTFKWSDFFTKAQDAFDITVPATEDMGDVAKKQLDSLDNVPTAGEMQIEGESEKTKAIASVDNININIGVAATPSAGAGSLALSGGPTYSQLTTKVSELYVAAVVGLNPIFAFIKSIVRWAATVMYCFFVMRELNEKLRTSMLLPQAKGNAAVGGTGGQITSLAAAASISVVLLTLPLALWSAYNTPWSTVGTSIASVAAAPINTGLTAVDWALSFLALVLPLDLLLILPPLIITVKKAGWAVILGVAAVVRFIVP